MEGFVERYRKELEQIHPDLPAYFYATDGYIMPWPKGPSGERLIEQYMLVHLDPNGKVDDEVLDELIRIWLSENWYGLANHPQIAFMLLRRHLEDPNSKLSKLLGKRQLDKEEVKTDKAPADLGNDIGKAIGVDFVSSVSEAPKTRNKRKV
jgi:hypothetical protein